jgi:hypothetical protein
MNAAFKEPARDATIARMGLPSADLPYSKLRTASGQRRSKAALSRSTSSVRPVRRNELSSAIVNSLLDASV